MKGCFTRTVGWLELIPTCSWNKGQQSLHEVDAVKEEQVIYLTGNIVQPVITELLPCQALK